MLSILRVTFPFFALVAAGYASVAWRWLAVDAVRALNTFVLYIAIPCMLFKFSAGLDVDTLASQPFVPVYGLVGTVLFFLLLIVGRLRQIAWKDLSFVSLVGVFPNTGFMGIPLVVSMVGARAATPAMAIVMFDMVVTSSLAVAASTLDGHNWSSAGKALGGALAGVFSNPMLWAILAGTAMAVMHWRPGPVWHEPIWMMADATTPVALFTMGGILARAQMEEPRQHAHHQLALFIAAKLIVHPLAMWVVVSLAVRAGWPIDAGIQEALVLLAALPSASNVSFLAERMDGNAAWVARVILWTTVGAFLTFTLWGWWLQTR